MQCVHGSGSFGCGGIWSTLWLQGQWPPEWAHVNIVAEELVLVVAACALWGHQWSGQHVQFHVDNMSVVQVLRKCLSKEPSGLVMHLLSCLAFLTAFHQFTITSCHIAGMFNTVADDISWPGISLYAGTWYSGFPNGNPSPSMVTACSGEARLDLQKVEVALRQIY